MLNVYFVFKIVICDVFCVNNAHGMWLWFLLLSPVLGHQDELPLPLAAPIDSTPQESQNPIETDAKCFAVHSFACPNPNEICRCKLIDNDSAVCCDISSTFQLTEGLACESVKNSNLTKIHVWNATLPDLDMFSKRNLSSLTITNSRFDKINLHGNLACLNISNNTITHLAEDSFIHLHNLEFLSLAGLNITKLPRFKINVTLDLAGILGLECSNLQQYLKDNEHIQFYNENITFCSSLKNFHWFASVEKVSLAQVQISRNIENNCIEDCRCKPHIFDMVAGKDPRFSVLVDCSYLGLQNLPKDLPPYTTSLNVSFNNITNLDQLGDDKSYQHIREFYADSNQVTSILALEGSKFIDNFLVLSLRDNHIKSLPTYILSNTFDRNSQLRTVNLGFNRISCNCSVAQVLKLWLLGNKKHIPDFDQIYCDNMAERVVELDVNKVCVYERDWTDYIYYIIAGEVGLLLLLVGKVSYDYWVFKTAGYLPWPASKMPKLPCDWVFE